MRERISRAARHAHARRRLSARTRIAAAVFFMRMQNATLLHARIAPIPSGFLQRVRREGRDALAQPVKRVIAKGGEPCRDVLRRARAGEALILASFSPFSRPGPYKEYGPIFVLAEEAHDAPDRAALRAGADDDYLRAQFVIRAYSEEEEILDAALTGPDDAQQVIDRFFAREDVAFLHARFPTYGCFACRLDRV